MVRDAAFAHAPVMSIGRLRLTEMRVRVLYFGVLKDALGRKCEEMTLPEGCSVAGLLATMEQRGAESPVLWGSVAIAVNREYVRASAVLREGDEVALLPPVSGGCIDAR